MGYTKNVLHVHLAIMYQTPRHQYHIPYVGQLNITKPVPRPAHVGAHPQRLLLHQPSAIVRLRPRQHLAKQHIIHAIHVILAIHVPPSPSVTNAAPTQQQNIHVLPTNPIATKQHACLIRPAWACGGPLGDGVCARTYRSCVNNKCVAATYWQCKDGYYGTPLVPESDVHECTKCPQTSDNVTVSTYNPKYQLPASTSTKITDCYVTGGSDITGSFKYTQKTSDTPYTCTYNN